MKKIDYASVMGYTRGLIANCYIHDYDIASTQDFVYHSIRLKYGIYDTDFLFLIKRFVGNTYRTLKIEAQIEKKCKHIKIKKEG